MAPHSSTLAWKIPWTEEPGRLQSMGLLRVGHDWATSRSLFTFMHWRRKWQPTPVFLPGESRGRGSLVGCRLWGRTESDTTEATWQQHSRLTMWQFQVNSEGTQPYRHMYPSPPTILPSPLPHNIEQSSMCCIVGPCWWSLLTTAVCPCPKLPISSPRKP